jgi:UDP-N-acetylglucosamine 2-epimerase (non-hydrolysing)
VVTVIFGTTGELIKLAPVLRRMHELERPPFVACTGQQIEQIPSLLTAFELPQPDVWLAGGAGGRDLRRRGDIPRWLSTVLWNAGRERGRMRRKMQAAPTRPLVLVHGDTMTTVLGALIGRAMAAPVAHLEAGLRSGDWRNPFPEELDRRIASRLAGVHLAPGPWAASNLRAAGVSGEIVDTGGNTIRDALNLVPPAAPHFALDEPFGVVSIHRFELLESPAKLRGFVDVLREHSRRTPLLFIDHPVTVAALEAAGLEDRFDERLRHVPRLGYFDFVALLHACAFMVTDSGGSQEECAALGKPCLVHRMATERIEGLDGPVALSHMDLDVVTSWLSDPLAHASAPAPMVASPSELVVSYFETHGFL